MLGIGIYDGEPRERRFDFLVGFSFSACTQSSGFLGAGEEEGMGIGIRDRVDFCKDILMKIFLIEKIRFIKYYNTGIIALNYS